LGVLEEDEHDQDHNNKIRTTFDEITKRKIMMEGRAGPTFECLSNEDHDENLLHTITIACITQDKTHIRIFLIEKNEFVTNTIED
jgi:hypothetical protein